MSNANSLLATYLLICDKIRGKQGVIEDVEGEPSLVFTLRDQEAVDTFDEINRLNYTPGKKPKPKPRPRPKGY